MLIIGILTLCLSTYSTIQNAEKATEHRKPQKDIHLPTDLPTLIPIIDLGKGPMAEARSYRGTTCDYSYTIPIHALKDYIIVIILIFINHMK